MSLLNGDFRQPDDNHRVGKTEGPTEPHAATTDSLLPHGASQASENGGWESTATTTAELRARSRHIQDSLGINGETLFDVGHMESVFQGLWQSVRHLTGEKAYPPEPAPPQNNAEARRLLDQVIHWCDLQSTPATKCQVDLVREERDGWIFKECLNRDLTYKAIAIRLARERKEHTDWQPITTKQGILRAIIAYAR